MGMEERAKRLQQGESDKAVASEKYATRAEFEDLVDAVPGSLDLLLNDVYPEAVLVDSKESAQGFGYRSLIDDQPVTEDQHRNVCQELLVRFRSILEWLAKHEVDPIPMISEASQVIEARFGREHRDPKFCPLLPLDILSDMASGKADATLLPQLMKQNVKTRLEGIREIVRPTLIALGLVVREKPEDITTQQTNSKTESSAERIVDDAVSEDPNSIVTKEHEPTEVWSGFHEPGVWYKCFNLNGQRWRAALREVWIPAGQAERDPLTPNRGKVKFLKSLLATRGVKEPGSDS